MKSRLLLSVAVLLVGGLLLSACGSGGGPSAPTQPPQPKGDPAAGQTAYQGTCAACHGLDAKGVSGLGKDLTTSEFVKGKSDAEMVAFLKQGRPSGDPLNTTGVDMPPKGGNPALTDTDLDNIVAYLRTINK